MLFLALTIIAAVVMFALIGWSIFNRKRTGFGVRLGFILLFSLFVLSRFIFLAFACIDGDQGIPPDVLAYHREYTMNSRKLADAVYNNKPNIIRELTANGVDLNIVMKEGGTFLHAASVMGRVECVRALLEGGANVHVTDAKGRTPLHKVAEFGMSDEVRNAITILLLQNGAAPDAINGNGDTPIDVAVANGNHKCAQILRNHISQPLRQQD